MFYVQTQAPAGNFADHMGSDSLKDCAQQAAYLISECNQVARVISRHDTVIIDENGKYQ